MTLTFELDQDRVKMNQNAKYLTQRSFSSDVYASCPDTQTYTQRTDCCTGTTKKWSQNGCAKVIVMLCYISNVQYIVFLHELMISDDQHLLLRQLTGFFVSSSQATSHAASLCRLDIVMLYNYQSVTTLRSYVVLRTPNNRVRSGRITDLKLRPGYYYYYY